MDTDDPMKGAHTEGDVTMSGPVSLPALDELIEHPERARDLSFSVAADLLAKLAGLQPLLLAQVLAGNGNGTHAPTQEEDHLLSVAEAAGKLGVSHDWLYRRAAKLPFTVRLGSSLRFSAQGVAKYIHQREGR
jgi:predicted DNA-binding transcriptional regulator AlpA